jgi:hypothetical protein
MVMLGMHSHGGPWERETKNSVPPYGGRVRAPGWRWLFRYLARQSSLGVSRSHGPPWERIPEYKHQPGRQPFAAANPAGSPGHS